nr:CRISPR-associated endoribonuclease Cas6 [uncultured Campylobacter sp.]
MLTIISRLPSANLKISKALPQLIQGYIYRYLPSAEHEGYRHEPSGKIFKRTNFDFHLNGANLRIRFTSYEPEFEKIIALAVLKDGLNLGELCLCDTTVAVSEHRTTQSKARLQGCVICSVQGLLGHKVFLEPQDSRHLEMMKTNALQRFETLTGHRYGGEFELNLLRQDLEKPLYFYYGNNQTPAKAWPAVWDIKALPELINTVLDAGVGGGCMNCGAGFLETI